MSARITGAMVEAAARSLCSWREPDSDFRVYAGQELGVVPVWKTYEVKAHAALAAALSIEPGVADGWQPIETARKKAMERVLLAFADGRVCEGYWGSSVYNRSTRQWEQDWVASPHSGPVRPMYWRRLPVAPLPEESSHG